MSEENINYFKELTKLNNELTNLKRTLEKKNHQINFQKEKIETIIENMPEGVISIKKNGTISLINKKALNILPENINIKNSNISEILKIFDLDSNKNLKSKLENIYKKGNGFINSRRVKLKLKEDNYIPLSLSAIPLQGKDINENAIITFGDISEQIKNEKHIKQLSLALKNINDSVVITDESKNIIYVNKSFIKTYNYNENDIIGKNYDVLQGPYSEDIDIFFDEDSIISNYHKTKNGDFIPVSVSKASIQEGSFQKKKYVFVIKNISKIKKLQDKLKENALFDHLTNALNKKAGITFLKKHIEEVNRHGSQFLLIFTDMNNLKEINDNFGHEEGNYAIKKLCEIIQKNLRDSDVLFRYGGDEFVLIITHCPKNYCVNIWNRIVSKIEDFNSSSKKPYNLSISKGIVEYSKNDNLTAKELIKKADKKMYEEKRTYHKKND